MREYQEERICKCCGKKIYVLHPSRWGYKQRGKHGEHEYFCSWSCMRMEENMKGRKLTQEQYDEAVRIANSGGDQLAYLKKCGAKNPSATWIYIKKKMEAKKPEEKPEAEEQKKTFEEVKKEIMSIPPIKGDTAENTDLKAKSLFSNVIRGGFFAKGERGVPLSIRTYNTMTLVARSDPFSFENNQITDCKLELTKEQWLQLIGEIQQALTQMEV